MSANRANIGWHITEQIPDKDQKVTGRVYEKEVKLTSAEILALNTTPKALVAAPGAGRVIEFMSAVLFLDYGTTTYVGGALTIQTITTNTTLSDSAAAANFIQKAADHYIMLQTVAEETQLDVNEGLELVADADPITGNGTITVKVMYRIHDFN